MDSGSNGTLWLFLKFFEKCYRIGRPSLIHPKFTFLVPSVFSKLSDTLREIGSLLHVLALLETRLCLVFYLSKT